MHALESLEQWYVVRRACICAPLTFSLLSRQLVELVQNWKFIHKPWADLRRLMILLGVALFIGTLPYIDQFAHIGGAALTFGASLPHIHLLGLLFGILSSIVFLPHISFDGWALARRRLVSLICLVGIVGLFIIMLSLLYTETYPTCRCAQSDAHVLHQVSHVLSSWCSKIDCIDFVAGLCDSYGQNIENN